MNRSLQQAFDFLDESNAVYELLSSLSDKEFDQSTQFKDWSFNDVIGHLHVWNYAADISLSDGEDWVDFSNKALKALGTGSSMNQFERTITNNLKGKDLLQVWKNYFLIFNHKHEIGYYGKSRFIRFLLTSTTKYF